MKKVLFWAILALISVCFFIAAEGSFGFGWGFKIGDKMSKLQFQVGVREMPKTVNVIPGRQ